MTLTLSRWLFLCHHHHQGAEPVLTRQQINGLWLFVSSTETTRTATSSSARLINDTMYFVSPSVSFIITHHVLNAYHRFTCFMPGWDPLLPKCGLFRFHYWQQDRIAYWLLDQIHFWRCAYSLLILHLFNSSASFVTFIVLLIFSMY